MEVRPLPAVLAVLTGLLSCTVLGKNSTRPKQIIPCDVTLCWMTPGMTKAQIELCCDRPNLTIAALHGLSLAVKECQHQFQNHRWNCSSLASRTKNPYTNAILQKGFRETAFIHALFSASVALSVARACNQGLIKCRCSNANYKKQGCPFSLQHGIGFARKFLDSRKDGFDIRSFFRLHNNKVGRKAVKASMQKKCKCHGVSGSCNLKVCWDELPDLRTVGHFLKEKYAKAYRMDQPNHADWKLNKIYKFNQKKHKHSLTYKPKALLSDQLIYYEASPSFCERTPNLDAEGTSGRSCNRSSRGPESCSSLCCGRGHSVILRNITKLCQCNFHWCCTVECKSCRQQEEITVCK